MVTGPAQLSLQQGLTQVLRDYDSAIAGPYTKHPLADFLRNGLPQTVRPIVGPDYLVTGSPGKGNWSETPWVAVFDPMVTTSAQRGLYPVYLFRGDGAGVFLSLNMGVKAVLDRVGRRY